MSSATCRRWGATCRRLVAAVLAATLAGLAGCASEMPAAGDADTARFTLNAALSLNPDVLGRPSPVVLRIYELAARDEFDRATFFELYDNDQAVLGKAALARTILVVHPGEQLHCTHPLDAKTRAIAIVVAYQHIDAARWRAVADISGSRPRAFRVELDRSAVKLTPLPGTVGPHGNMLGRLVKPVWKVLAGMLGGTK